GIGVRRVPPADLRLTVDFEIQRNLEHLLAQKVEETQADGAMAVVMEAGSGAVLAAAIVPSFDPNRWQDASASARRNRIVTDAFEPGSTVKPFVVARALGRGLIKLDEPLWCEMGFYRVYDHPIRDDGEQHGNLTPAEILAKSSNICTAKIAEKLG